MYFDWFSNRLIPGLSSSLNEFQISHPTIWRDFIDKRWNNSILNAPLTSGQNQLISGSGTRWFQEKSCQNKVVTITILQNDEISLLITFWFSNQLISSLILCLKKFQNPHQRFDEILSINRNNSIWKRLTQYVQSIQNDNFILSRREKFLS